VTSTGPSARARERRELRGERVEERAVEPAVLIDQRASNRS